MKTSCYIVQRKYPSVDKIVGVTATPNEAKELRLLITKKDISNNHIFAFRFEGATEEEYEKYAKEFYSIYEVNFYSKPFDIEEL